MVTNESKDFVTKLKIERSVIMTIEKMRSDMVAAMKAKDTERKNALSLLLAALKAKAKDKREDLTEEEENAIIQKEIKQTRETMDAAPADRDDIRQECQLCRPDCRRDRTGRIICIDIVGMKLII